MKKLLLLFLIPCLLLCSCSMQDSVAITSDEETTTENTVETTAFPYPDLSGSSLNGLEEYNAFLYHIPVPERFVTLDVLPEMGRFYRFILSGGLSAEPDCKTYLYYFEPTTYADGDSDSGLFLEIRHQSTPWVENNTLEPAISSNMIFYSGTGDGGGSFWVGDVEYEYSLGILQAVIWTIEDTVFTLRSAPNEEFGFQLFRMDETEFDFIRDLLNAETAEAAIERFAAKLRGKTNADGE